MKVSDLSVKLFVSQYIYFATLNTCSITHPWACATSASMGRSATRRVGFDIDSVYTTLVLAVNAPATAAASVMSTKVQVMPHFCGKNSARSAQVPEEEGELHLY